MEYQSSSQAGLMERFVPLLVVKHLAWNVLCPSTNYVHIHDVLKVNIACKETLFAMIFMEILYLLFGNP